MPTQRLATLDQLDRVIYVGGLSKTLSSSLRIGYLAASRDLVKHLVDVKVLTSLGGTRFAESVAASLLERGTYRKYLERLRKRVRDSLSNAVQTLESYGWDVFDEPSGGNFVWAKVPSIDDSNVLVDEALKLGVTLTPGSYYPRRNVPARRSRPCRRRAARTGRLRLRRCDVRRSPRR